MWLQLCTYGRPLAHMCMPVAGSLLLLAPYHPAVMNCARRRVELLFEMHLMTWAAELAFNC